MNGADEWVTANGVSYNKVLKSEETPGQLVRATAQVAAAVTQLIELSHRVVLASRR